MTTRKAYQVQTLNTGTGNPGWTLKVLAVSPQGARAKFAKENPGVAIHSVKPWGQR